MPYSTLEFIIMKHATDDYTKTSYKCINLKLVKDGYILIKHFATSR